MTRLIDADVLLIQSRRVVEYDEAGFSMEYNAVPTEEIKNAPTVEAVPVVRCKDCKHSDLPAVLTLKYGKPGTLTSRNSHSPCNNRNVDKEDFCSRGEVKEGADMRKKVE